VHRISETKDFANAFAKANEEQRAKLILISNAKDMRVWMAMANNQPLAALSYRKLRDMAKSENVFNYSRLTRDEIIAALEQRRARSVETSTRPH